MMVIFWIMLMCSQSVEIKYSEKFIRRMKRQNKKQKNTFIRNL